MKNKRREGQPSRLFCFSAWFLVKYWLVCWTRLADCAHFCFCAAYRADILNFEHLVFKRKPYAIFLFRLVNFFAAAFAEGFFYLVPFFFKQFLVECHEFFHSVRVVFDFRTVEQSVHPVEYCIYVLHIYLFSFSFFCEASALLKLPYNR